MKDEYKETAASKFLKEKGISAKDSRVFTYYELKEFLEDYQTANYIKRIRKASLFVDDKNNHSQWYRTKLQP